MAPKAANRRRQIRQSANANSSNEESKNKAGSETPQTKAPSARAQESKQADGLDLDIPERTNPLSPRAMVSETVNASSAVNSLQLGVSEIIPETSINDSLSALKKPKPLKFQPKSALRRSKSEREAIAREEAERETVRQRSLNDASSRGGHRGKHGGRGGSDRVSHWRKGREPQEWQASGVLGGDTVVEKPQRAKRGGVSTGRGTSGRAKLTIHDDANEGRVTETERRAKDRVKKEDGNKSGAEVDSDGDVVMDSGKSKRKTAAAKPKTEEEEEQQESFSDDARWDDDAGPKLDIAQISLISDEEEDTDEAAQSETAKGKQRERTPHPATLQLRPVRLERHDHVESQFGINTDPSSLASAVLRRRAKEKNQADGPLFTPDEDTAKVIESTRKIKRKTRDVEFLRNERRWKGVYEDDEDIDDTIMIKQEPADEDVVMITGSSTEREQADAMDLDDEQATSGVRGPTSIEGGVVPIPEENVDGTAVSRNSRLRRPKIRGYQKPYSTQLIVSADEDDEDFAEMVKIFKEFQQDPDQPATEDSVESTDAKPLPDLSDLKGSSIRENKVFLMQLPPVMPALLDVNRPPPKVKAEKAKTPIPEKQSNPFAMPAPATKSEPGIKKVPGGAQDGKFVPNAYNVNSFAPIAGCPGTLTIYDSGTIKANWGGLDLEIIQSRAAGFGQEVLLHDHHCTNTKVEDESRWEEVVRVGEEAHSMGVVEGGFVAGPDWGSLLGA